MTIDIQNKAWFSKYQPKNINDLIFDNDEHKQLMQKWITDETITGNILFYGKNGLGKTSSVELLINAITKVQNDLYVCKDRSVKEIRENVKPFLAKRPVKSKCKIVYLEEADKLHPDAINILKVGLLEKYQDTCSFICCTNYIGKLKQKDEALLSRFTYKIPFSGKNIEGIFNRITEILKIEKAEYDEIQLKEFINKSLQLGIREIINKLQISYIANNGKIDFQNIQGYAGIEETATNLIINIIRTISALNPRDKRICIIQPLNSPIAKDYQALCSILHNNYDINFDSIYDVLYETSKFLPLQLIIAKHADQNEFKKYPHVNILACLKKMMECMISIIG